MRLIFALLACAAILCGRAEASQARHHFTTVEIAASAKVAGQYELMRLAQVGQIPGWPPLQPASAPYVGPGNTYVGTPFTGVSCSRAFTAALAALLAAVCDVVDTATGLVTCTYHLQANGFVNSSECTGAGQACQTACSLTKGYDQTGNGRHFTQATLANMPAIVFSSTPKGTLPAISCGTGATVLLVATAVQTQNQPLTTFAVSITTSNAVQGGLIGDQNGGVILLGSDGTANTIRLAAAVAVTKGSVTDNAWHALGSLASGASSILSADGSNSTGLNAGSAGISGQVIRLCRSNAIQYAGTIAEAWIYASAGTTTDFNNLSTNAHSASSGYNF